MVVDFYYDELNWLKNLPLYLEDGQNILVHAGFDLDLALHDQDRETMLWTREAYINPPVDIHEDFNGKTIVTGHTPTGLIKKQDNSNQNHPILSDNITDVIEAIYNYYDYSYNNPESIPKNFHLEIPLLQTKLIQQKYNRKD